MMTTATTSRSTLELAVTAPAVPVTANNEQAVVFDVETTLSASVPTGVLEEGLITGSTNQATVSLLHTKKAVPSSVLELFWYIMNQVWQPVRAVLNEGISAWIEAFSHLSTTTQELDTLMNNHSGGVKQAQRASGNMPAPFGLHGNDVEAVVLNTRVAKQSFQTVAPAIKTSTQRDSWLSNNQWSGLDTLFPARETRAASPKTAAITVENQAVLEADVVEGVVIAPPPTRTSQETTQNILVALQEAYATTPMSPQEESALQQHPLSQRGRAVKQSINQLVETYFAQEHEETTVSAFALPE